MRTIELLSAAAVLALSGCAAGKYYDAAQRYRSKNGHACLEYLALCLKEDPNHEEAKAMALEVGRALAEETASKTEQMSRDGKYEGAVGECDRMLVSANLISTMPGNMSVFADADLRARMADKAAAQFYEQGTGFESSDAKKAAICFRRALGFKKGYKDAQARYNKAREAALIKLELPAFVVESKDGNELAQMVTTKFRAALGELKSEFMTLAAAGAPADGRIVGKIMAGYEDSGLQEERKSHEHSEPVMATDANGNQLYDQSGNPIQATDAAGNPLVNVYRAQWSVFQRRTAASITISYDIVMKDGTTVISGSKDGSAEASVVYRSHINGHVQAVRNSPTPDDENLPDRQQGIASPGQLAAGLVEERVKLLAKQIFDHYKD